MTHTHEIHVNPQTQDSLQVGGCGGCTEYFDEHGTNAGNAVHVVTLRGMSFRLCANCMIELRDQLGAVSKQPLVARERVDEERERCAQLVLAMHDKELLADLNDEPMKASHSALNRVARQIRQGSQPPRGYTKE